MLAASVVQNYFWTPAFFLSLIFLMRLTALWPLCAWRVFSTCYQPAAPAAGWCAALTCRSPLSQRYARVLTQAEHAAEVKATAARHDEQMVVKTDWLRAPDTRTTTDERECCACVHDCFAARLSRPRQRRAAGEARAERLDCRAITMARTHARSDRAARQAAKRPAVSEANAFAFYGFCFCKERSDAQGWRAVFFCPPRKECDALQARRTTQRAQRERGARRMPRRERVRRERSDRRRADGHAGAARPGGDAHERHALPDQREGLSFSGHRPLERRRNVRGQFDAAPLRGAKRSAPKARPPCIGLVYL